MSCLHALPSSPSHAPPHALPHAPPHALPNATPCPTPCPKPSPPAASFPRIKALWLETEGQLFGQTIMAFAHIFSAVGMPVYSAIWHPTKERVLSTSILFFATILGGGTGFVLAPLIIGENPSRVPLFFLVQAIIGTVACVPALAFQRKPPTPPSRSAEVAESLPSTSFCRDIARLCGNGQFLILLLAFCLGFAIMNTVAITAQDIFKDYTPLQVRRGAKAVKRPPQQPAQLQYANYWAPLTRQRHIPPHPAQPRHTNNMAPRTRKRHQQEHQPQRPTESSDPTQHAKGRTGDCPGPRKETTTRRNVTPGGGRRASAEVRATPAATIQGCSMPTCATRRDGVAGPHVHSSVRRQVVDDQDNTRRSGALGPHAPGNTAWHVMDDLNAEGNDPCDNQHNPQSANYWAPLMRQRH